MRYANKNTLINTCIIASFLLLQTFTASAQKNKHTGDVFVDNQGIMRWGDTKEEVQGFGVNYTAPFAHAYRNAGKLGIDLKEAIDNDVYHFSRLGFDLYRIHVWDTEISDAEGNLLENEHLEMFDYLLMKLKERGINYVITPIAFWGNGWPEPDEETPGFSHKYGKDASLTNTEAIKAQQNYLKQFLNHVNPLTGVAYKNDPSLIAFEVSNEPHHRGTPKEVTSFIKKMVKAMRSTGTKKPIFYNISHSVQLADAYFDAGIQGGTFQWYPTGLGFRKELAGNLLPNVNDYNIPFDDKIKKAKGAKLVYEFDAADVNKSYMYPAMARSFREAGIQIATHFAYDPTFLAAHNTEYNTHYMNLSYTPQKAIALMISGKVFHELPMNKDYGTYPENLKFEDFTIDYTKDLAIYNTENSFFYTNSNNIVPKELEKLTQIAGFGNSELVTYQGKGAYFLDKIENGVWRLEVMPDVILVDNPFGTNSLKKIISVINYKEWNMKLSLPDLAQEFTVEAINEGNSYSITAKNKGFSITPGTYLLKNAEITKAFSGKETLGNIKLAEFTAPPSNLDKTYLVHTPSTQITQGNKYEVMATVVSPATIESVMLYANINGKYKALEMAKGEGYNYSSTALDSIITPGYLNYRVVVKTSEGSIAYPGAVSGDPFAWDNFNREEYTVPVFAKDSALEIFNASQDSEDMVAVWKPGNKLVPLSNGEVAYQVNIENLFEEDVENKGAAPIYDYSFRYNFSEKIKNAREKLSEVSVLVLKAGSTSEKNEKLQVAFVDRNGASFGKIIVLKPGVQEYQINFNELQPVRTVTLPRPYPSFLPYYFQHDNKGDFNLQNVESIQFSIGPGLNENEQKESHHLQIISLSLQ
ncbi:hypothetical protein L1I30_12850 [Gillisia sp. M10.2A]|uniref:Cellulase (Glycosyl hydrolase family 5) n=1 Tax=Gillisia lutea TaxID=2909668 RepID=A0ABS9EI86_9FLAO|nr:hypothetical protein [Gillisia lutea]MCF4102557.1 hypothetical protein [Gillisia lutea]